MRPGGSQGKDMEQAEGLHWHAQLCGGGDSCGVSGLHASIDKAYVHKPASTEPVLVAQRAIKCVHQVELKKS